MRARAQMLAHIRNENPMPTTSTHVKTIMLSQILFLGSESPVFGPFRNFNLNVRCIVLGFSFALSRIVQAKKFSVRRFFMAKRDNLSGSRTQVVRWSSPRPAKAPKLFACSQCARNHFRCVRA